MARRWTCPRCGRTLGAIRDGALHATPGVAVRYPHPAVVEVVCACGNVKVWFGGRVIVPSPARGMMRRN